MNAREAALAQIAADSPGRLTEEDGFVLWGTLGIGEDSSEQQHNDGARSEKCPARNQRTRRMGADPASDR